MHHVEADRGVPHSVDGRARIGIPSSVAQGAVRPY